MKSPSPHCLNDWQSHPFLEGLSAAHLAVLTDCTMPVDFRRGELIFREGEVANRFYLIYEGTVVIESEDPERPPTKVDQVRGGDVLGWSWLFPPYLWHFTARALTDIRAMFFYGTRLREACDQDHDLGYEIMKRTTRVMTHRLEATQRQLARSSS